MLGTNAYVMPSYSTKTDDFFEVAVIMILGPAIAEFEVYWSNLFKEQKVVQTSPSNKVKYDPKKTVNLYKNILELDAIVTEEYPQLDPLITNRPLTIPEVQKNLGKDETLIFASDAEGLKYIPIFQIEKDSISSGQLEKTSNLKSVSGATESLFLLSSKSL